MYSIKLAPKCYLWVDEHKTNKGKIFCVTSGYRPKSYDHKKSKIKWYFDWYSAITIPYLNGRLKSYYSTAELSMRLAFKSVKYLPKTTNETSDIYWLNS